MKMNKIKQITYILCKFVKNMALKISKMRKCPKENLIELLDVKQICVTGLNPTYRGVPEFRKNIKIVPPIPYKRILLCTNDKNILHPCHWINKKHNITIIISGLNTFVLNYALHNTNYRLFV